MRIHLALLLPTVLAASGCVSANPRCCPPTRRASVPIQAPTPMKEATHVLYDGRLGTPTTLDAFVGEALGTDLVVFGELHGQPVGAEYELALLKALDEKGGRPVAIAMEFFEADTQEAVDAYLAGDMDAETFQKETKRNAAYAKTHGPLVDWAKANGAPVIAANAPRKLVSGYRKAKTDYPAFLESLTEEERALLPESMSVVEDEYWERFSTLMGEKMAKPFFLSQSLWDDAMAESMAEFRASHPNHRILFIVGAFHVTEGLGTITKYSQRRPDDKVSALIMSMSPDGTLAWDEADHHAGNAVLMVKPPKKRERKGPNPHASPKAEKIAEPKPTMPKLPPGHPAPPQS